MGKSKRKQEKGAALLRAMESTPKEKEILSILKSTPAQAQSSFGSFGTAEEREDWAWPANSIPTSTATASAPVTTPSPKGGILYKHSFCRHHGLTPLFNFDGADVCGAAYFDLACEDEAALLVKLTGYRDDPVISTPKAYAALRRFAIQGAPTLSIDWPDRGSPPLLHPFWPTLVELLPTSGRVVIFCQGGHGRTGTALAVLGIIGMGWTPEVAIAMIRRLHCKEAIETLIQMRYIQEFGIWWKNSAARYPKAVKRAENCILVK